MAEPEHIETMRCILQDNPFVVAPMVNASELAFRTLARRHGCHLAYSPMLHARHMVEKPGERKRFFTTAPGDEPLVVQFCANDPDVLVEAAQFVKDHCTCICLNLGCPQGIARKGYYGAFLQDDWELIANLIQQLRAAVSMPVSAKIRIFEDVQRTVNYAKMLQDVAGVSMLAVHGRCRDQTGKTAGPASWEAIRAVKEALHIPVIANGNIYSREDALECLRVTGCDGVMSAVWLLENPALFEGGDADRIKLAWEYLDIAEECNTPNQMVRPHLFKMLRRHLDSQLPEFSQSLSQARTWSKLRTFLSRFEDAVRHKAIADGTSDIQDTL